jgi:hypothetical protein
MKRDYLNLIVYYNENRENNDINIDEIFKKYIPFDSILPEDIEYLIENNLGYLIKYLDGKFIQLNHNLYFPDHITYKKYPFVNSMKYFIELSTKINPNEFDKFNDVTKTNNYKYIIDAGNIIHSRNGMFTEESILDLQTVVNNFKDSLIIIHKMHLKNGRIMEIIADKLYYPTPYKCNDDIFIILAYLANNCKIISNDNYKDHTIDNTEMRNFIFDDLVKFKTTLITPDRLDTELSRSRSSWTGNGVDCGDITNFIRYATTVNKNTCVEEIILYVNFNSK